MVERGFQALGEAALLYGWSVLSALSPGVGTSARPISVHIRGAVRGGAALDRS
ncbi:MAG: hypothetical protein RL385_5551, partial [Pseudomonadota bacterium]